MIQAQCMAPSDLELLAASLAEKLQAINAPQAVTTITFGELWALYYEKRVKLHHKEEGNAKYWWSAHGSRWQAIQVHQIRRMDVQAWVDDLAMGSPSAAWRAVSVLSAVINWGLQRDYLPMGLINPCIGVEKPKTKSRKRFLKPGELRRFLDALQSESATFRDFFALSLLTGARKGNMLAMKWSAIDFDLATWTIPADEFKNGDEHVIPLNQDALAILSRRRALNTGSPWVFPSNSESGHIEDPKRAWKRITDRAQLEDLHIHDLRRTIASYMAIKGCSQYAIGKLLGHKDVRSTAVYARLDLDSVREGQSAATAFWAELMSQPVEVTPPLIEVRAKEPAVGEAPKNHGVTITARQQVIVEAKILTAMQWGGNTKKDFYRKVGSQIQLNSQELDRVLKEMEAKGLIRSEIAAKNVTRYTLAE